MGLRTTVLSLAVFLLLQVESAAAQILRGVTVSDHISAGDIEDLADWNPNVVRYPLLHLPTYAYEDEAGFYSRLDRALNMLDERMPFFQANGMKVIIEMYSPPGGFASVKGRAQHRIFSEMWAQQALINGWRTIAARYKDNTTVWGYDIVNEPAQNKVVKGLLNWPKLSAAVAYQIRTIDPTHKIIIETAYGNPTLISKHKPLPLANIVFSVHIYHPNKFAQQGLHGLPLGLVYPSKKINKKEVLKVLKPVIKFQKKYGAEIYVGEYSVVRWAPGNSAYNYLADVIDIMESNGWHSTYHAYREASAWSVEHSSSYHDTYPALSTTDREMLLRQYFGRN